MASNNDFAPACPTDCTDETLLAASDLCLTDDSIETGEITDFIISEKGTLDPTIAANVITGWVDSGLAADATVNEAAINTWFAAIDNATGTIKHFEVIGNKPEANTTTATGAKKTTINLDTTHTIEVDIIKKSNLNYEFYRKLQCGGNYIVWYGTSKYLYGGINGISGRVIKASAPLERGDGLSVIKVTFEWNADSDPPRDKKPWI